MFIYLCIKYSSRAQHRSATGYSVVNKTRQAACSQEVCVLQRTGQSVFVKEEACLKRIKTKEPDLDGGVKKAFLKKCSFTEAGGVSGVWPSQTVEHADLRN